MFNNNRVVECGMIVEVTITNKSKKIKNKYMDLRINQLILLIT